MKLLSVTDYDNVPTETSVLGLKCMLHFIVMAVVLTKRTIISSVEHLQKVTKRKCQDHVL